MTEPTQNDLPKRLRATNVYIDGKWFYPPICSEAADEIERLTAVAKVGGYLMHCEACGTLTDSGQCDCTKMNTGTQRLVPWTLKDLRETDNATIERCAQVAEKAFNDPAGYISRKIAAAIRALKEKG